MSIYLIVTVIGLVLPPAVEVVFVPGDQVRAPPEIEMVTRVDQKYL